MNRTIDFGIVRDILRDDQGEPYPPDKLPCTQHPTMWDADANPQAKRIASVLCREECPALAACGLRRKELKTLADGVWAGKIINRRTDTNRHDPQVKAWAEMFGIELPGQG